jgi:hypothetical protein
LGISCGNQNIGTGYENAPFFIMYMQVADMLGMNGEMQSGMGSLKVLFWNLL